MSAPAGGRSIRAVAVVVPARDEQHHIDACLAGIESALAGLPPGITTSVTVVLDRCVDRTAAIVTAWCARGRGVRMVRVTGFGKGRARTTDGGEPTFIVAGRGVGALRDLGVREALADLDQYPPDTVWLLHTDADTVVPPGWARDHVALADTGIDGVAGLADLSTTAGLSPHARKAYRAMLDDGVDGPTHGHVYGANLGVRADAYLDTGGFPPDGAGEDHGLWQQLAAAGRPLRSSTTISVRTSARTGGRAHGGLAALLQRLNAAGGDTDEAEPASS